MLAFLHGDKGQNCNLRLGHISMKFVLHFRHPMNFLKMATEILDTSPTLLTCLGTPFLVMRGHAVRYVEVSLECVAVEDMAPLFPALREKSSFFICGLVIHSTKARTGRRQIVKMIVTAFRK